MTSTVASFLPPPRNISNAVENRKFDDFKDQKTAFVYAIERGNCVHEDERFRLRVYRSRVIKISAYLFLYFILSIELINSFLFQFFCLKAAEKFRKGTVSSFRSLTSLVPSKNLYTFPEILVSRNFVGDELSRRRFPRGRCVYLELRKETFAYTIVIKVIVRICRHASPLHARLPRNTPVLITF